MSDSKPTTQSYFPWVVIRISSDESNKTFLRIQEATIVAGQFYREDDFDNEIPLEEINKMICKPGEKIYVSACGLDPIERHGVQGSFILTQEDKLQIRQFKWKNTPSGISEFSVTGNNDSWIVSWQGNVSPDHEIGYITVEVSHAL